MLERIRTIRAVRRAKRRGRPLSWGEIALVASVFGDAIDVGRVRVHHRKWWFLQPSNIVMAPDGHIWFHPKSPSWRDDFTAASLDLRALFVHELCHVWQHQRGVNLILKRGPIARYDYLPLEPGKPFAAYGIEQQAEIVRDAYVLREGGEVAGAPPLTAYAALIPFGEWGRRAPLLV